MTTEQTSVAPTPLTEERVATEIRQYLELRTTESPAPEQDLFRSGVLSSLSAMELVIHLERSYQISVGGSDLRLGNFRSIRTMTDLVLRLQDDSSLSTVRPEGLSPQRSIAAAW